MNDHTQKNVSYISEKRSKVKTSIYLLPNLITAASLFFGLLAIKYSIDGRLVGDANFFVYAAYAILAAAVCDALDGSVARLTHTQSSFGVQMDSLCDVVSFGIAPAVVAYNYCLHEFVRLGFCVGFIFAICGALRLARFNVQSSLGKTSGNFSGLPIPGAATPIAVYILAQAELTTWKGPGFANWAIHSAEFMTTPLVKSIFLLVIMFLLALAMVSTFEYLSHKALKLPRKKPLQVFAAVVICVAIFFNLQFIVSLAVFTLIYCLHGPILWFFKRKEKSDEDELFDSEDHD